MGTSENIKKILAQPDYKVEKNVVYRLGMFDEWKKVQLISNGRYQMIQLVEKGKLAENYLWADVLSVMRGETENIVLDNLPVKSDFMNNPPMGNILVDERDGSITRVKSPLPKDYLTSKEIAKALNIPTRTKIRSAEIKIIRKMIADKKKDSEIAKAINASLHSTMYIIKQIKAGKKLKWEN